jgi:hypothetical protein
VIEGGEGETTANNGKTPAIGPPECRETVNKGKMHVVLLAYAGNQEFERE